MLLPLIQLENTLGAYFLLVLVASSLSAAGLVMGGVAWLGISYRREALAGLLGNAAVLVLVWVHLAGLVSTLQ